MRLLESEKLLLNDFMFFILRIYVQLRIFSFFVVLFLLFYPFFFYFLIAYRSSTMHTESVHVHAMFIPLDLVLNDDYGFFPS